MYGALLGDMIGAPYEFDRGNKTKEFPLFCEDSHLTDDSVMTIAVAEALLDCQFREDEDIKAGLIESMRKWGKKYPNAGYGRKFYHWLHSRHPEPYGSYGNGSAMRVSSAGWLFDTIEQTRHMARLTAEVTHNHPEGIKGAEATASAIFLARTGHSKDEIKGGGVFHRFATWRNRITKHSDTKDVPPEEYDIDKNYQVGHANIAIATSGVIGKGPGNSTERDYLPQAFSDFIYAIVIEEMGIFGAVVVVFLYVILLFRAARIAGRCENNFPAFLVMGLALLLVLQATINMLVAVQLMPVTGQPLPLISKGGTSTIINCAYIGVILSVSRSAKRNDVIKKTTGRKWNDD